MKPIAIILGILLIAATTLLFMTMSHGGKMWHKPVDDSTATANVKSFRDRFSLTKKSHGSYYEYNDVKFYVDSIYPKLVRALEDSLKDYLIKHPEIDFNLADYRWTIGNYWMMSKKSGKTKHDYCIVPTLVKTDGTVCDYFDLAKFPFYSHTLKMRIKRVNGKLQFVDDEETKGAAFNTGTLFP